jgi:ATP synthase regulation protein NCA2
LEQSLVDAKASFAMFVASHVTEPIRGIYKQVLANVSAPTAAGVAGRSNEEALGDSQQSLQRMVENFSIDHPGLRGAGGMDAVLAAFEAQVRRPIRSALSGDLVETMLIISAKLKSDIEEILVGTSRQLTAQRINLHILAAVPAVLAALGLAYGVAAAVRASRKRSAAALSHESATARFCVGDARDLLVGLGAHGRRASSSVSLRERELTGRLVCLLGDVHWLINTRVVHVGGETRWRLRRDIQRLENCQLSVSTRIALIDRMFLVYSDALQSR